MRIAWFTPISVRSAIADFSVNVAEALSERGEVDLWTVDAGERPRSTSLATRPAEQAAECPEELEGYDAIVYNLGNYPRYHDAIVDALERRRGVVILHDRTYYDLFWARWHKTDDPLTYADKLEAYYGEEGRRHALSVEPAASVFEYTAHRRFRLFEEILGNAEGVVVHSTTHADDVEEHWHGPLLRLFLPAYASSWEPVEQPSGARRSSRRMLLLTVGHVNQNKQIHAVVEALAADAELARRVRYAVVGAYDSESAYYAHLRQRIHEAGLENTIEFLGHQPENALRQMTAEAALFVNLRFPNLEGSSASLMRQLPVGKPVLVYASGVFSELPEDTVAQIDSLEPAAITSALRRLLDDERLRKEIGRSGQEWARQLTPARYADRLLGFISRDVRPLRPLLALTDRAAVELGTFRLDTRLPVVDRVAAEIATLDPRSGFDLPVMIRELDARDAGPLGVLFERNDVNAVRDTFDPFPLTAESARSLLEPQRKDHFYGFFHGHRLLGFSMLRGWDEGHEIPSFGIFVDAAAHGHGLGRRLTVWTLAEAERLGCPALRLSVYARNAHAQRMYAEQGFVESERETVDHDGLRDERIVMLKSLGGEHASG